MKGRKVKPIAPAVNEWAEFDAKHKVLRDARPSHDTRFSSAMGEVHSFHEEALWFSGNTPNPFRTEYHPSNLNFASVAVRYACELASLGNEDSIREIALLSVQLCECMDELITREDEDSERAAGIMKWVAEELPYWPMLQTFHSAGNNHFPRLAERLSLGAKSWVNVSAGANYSLQTPINRYAWRVLRLFQQAHWWIRQDDKTPGQFDRWLMMTPAEKAIARESFALGKPTKATAKDWIDRAIMPFVDEREKDFERVPDFAQAVNRAKMPKRYLQRKEIRRDLLRAVESITSEV